MDFKQIVKKGFRTFGVEVLGRRYLEKIQQENSQMKERICHLESQHDRMTHFSSLGLSLQFNKEHGACFLNNLGIQPQKVIICSVPKCGTYFIAEILKELGFADTQFHLWQDFIHDYRGQDVEGRRSDVLPRQVEIPLKDSLGLLLPGQFGLGHFNFCPENQKLFRGFKVVHVYRDLRAACVSMMRFASELKPQSHWFLQGDWQNQKNKKDMFLQYMTAHGKKYYDWIEPVVQWHDKPGVCSLSYEALSNNDGSVRASSMKRLGQFLNLKPLGMEFDHIAANAAKTKTMTSSGNPSKWQDYWGDEVEILFENIGFLELNRQLGYDKTQPNSNTFFQARAA